MQNPYTDLQFSELLTRWLRLKVLCGDLDWRQKNELYDLESEMDRRCPADWKLDKQ